ncbi:hypothetical protein BS78_01G424300 [Paspalum vaginatum]|nr:hypothetical protein BS78_01G424300 [Paspalum vaginatum]
MLVLPFAVDGTKGEPCHVDCRRHPGLAPLDGTATAGAGACSSLHPARQRSQDTYPGSDLPSRASHCPLPRLYIPAAAVEPGPVVRCPAVSPSPFLLASSGGGTGTGGTPTMARGGSAAVAVGALLAMLLLCAPAAAELPRLEHPAKNDGSLSLLVVGDWGRKGSYNQSRVADQMGKVGDRLNIDFVISTGDNFYEDGLTGTDDQAFEQSFTDIYTAKSLQRPWYLVLGNHDYRGDALAQLSPVLHKIDSRFICMRSFIVNAEIVDFFFVDTTPFQLKYWTHPKDDHYDWRGVAPREKYIDNLLKDLDEAMKKSTAAWKIAVGHHTMRSVSDHGDTQELLQLLLPVLQDNGVDFYINGHDHCLEHISSRDSPIQYFTSGGGSKAWRGVFEPNEDKLEFFYDGQGFMSLQLDHNKAEFIFYDVNGNVLYQYTRTSLRTGHLQPSGYVSEK